MREVVVAGRFVCVCTPPEARRLSCHARAHLMVVVILLTTLLLEPPCCYKQFNDPNDAKHTDKARQSRADARGLGRAERAGRASG